MAEGTVRWFGGKRPDGKTRGYGFITQDSGEEIFVHYSEIEKDKEGFKTLLEGQRVSFEVGPGQDGKDQAMNVRVIGTAASAAAVAPATAAPAAAAPESDDADAPERDDIADDEDEDDD